MSLKADYHTHPNIVKEFDVAEAFIQKAIDLKFDRIGITDHCPIPGYHLQRDRIPEGELERYLDYTHQLAEKYGGSIEIMTGLEVDYHPDYEQYIDWMLSKYKFDYVIGSVHLFLPFYGLDFYKKDANAVAHEFLEVTLQAAQSGFFDIIAHIDMYRWLFDQEEYLISSEGYSSEMHLDLLRQLFEAIQEKDLFLEINSHGLRKSFKEQYPSPSMLELASEYRIRYIFGSDAHKPEDVGFAYESLEDKLSESFGLRFYHI